MAITSREKNLREELDLTHDLLKTVEAFQQ